MSAADQTAFAHAFDSFLDGILSVVCVFFGKTKFVEKRTVGSLSRCLQ
jgi:hypothetical protein